MAAIAAPHQLPEHIPHVHESADEDSNDGGRASEAGVAALVELLRESSEEGDLRSHLCTRRDALRHPGRRTRRDVHTAAVPKEHDCRNSRSIEGTHFLGRAATVDILKRM